MFLEGPSGDSPFLPEPLQLRTKMNLTWRNPHAHHWYAAKSPGLSLQYRSSRVHQTASACFRSGYLRGMTFG
ncbi:hypothetical protein TNCV_3811251 [Trichonephila clavipes]|nr:hypothetical protein TNCV_3811251 [Trichonephila clavipes]